ncbi:MAG TPA: CPBP family intramembrane glutamic endopeptidase [Candidatus Acidoferrum sp.]|nr:CPBP family intramembrane glutamic endopeptidase [Candidatus Acidoferrum sp.]
MTGFKNDNDFGCILLMTLSFQGATWILMAIFFRMHDLSWGEGIGLKNGNLRSALLLALAMFIVVLPVTYVLQEVSVTLMEKIHWMPKEEPAVTLLMGATSRASAVYLGFFAVVLAPVAEEFIFRGVLFPFVKQLGFPKTAWIGISLLFALIHATATIFIPLFVLALALTWLYEKTGTLMAPIFAHALFNVSGLVLIPYLSR